MFCPRCQIGTSPRFAGAGKGHHRGHYVEMSSGNCTECSGLIVFIGPAASLDAEGDNDGRLLVFPRRVPPRSVPDEVTGDYAQDFREACLVLDDSPKASAALSRRLLQHVIREKACIKRRNLDEEIDALIESNTLAGDLADDLDMVRTLGNFAAHPIKSTDTGAIVDVEPGEAEGLIDLLEELLNHYFVRPARREKKRAQLNEKLASAGKPPLKGTPPTAPEQATPTSSAEPPMTL